MGNCKQILHLQEHLLHTLFAGTALILGHFYNFVGALPSLKKYHSSAV
jgi:hypothetical protein